MKLYDKALGVIAKGCGLDPQLVRAIIQVESSGDSSATRYEPAFYEKYVKGGHYHHAWHHELATSWGLMQIMGLTARESGYRGDMMDLLIPEVGILYGCLYLSKCWKRYGGNLEEAIASYNAGSARRDPEGRFVNQGYVDKVLKVLEALKAR